MNKKFVYQVGNNKKVIQTCVLFVLDMTSYMRLCQIH